MKKRQYNHRRRGEVEKARRDMLRYWVNSYAIMRAKNRISRFFGKKFRSFKIAKRYEIRHYERLPF